MQVAAVLTLDGQLDIAAVRSALADRIRAVPRLRQRLVPTPPGCGRPVWVDDAEFDIAHHVQVRKSPYPGDETTLLDVTADVALQRLPRDRPLWSATLVSDLADGRNALVLVVHHVLADGIGGLAVLAQLVDGAPPGAEAAFPLPAPSPIELLVDASATRLQSLRQLPMAARLVGDAAAELWIGRVTSAPRCSLNQPTGPRRCLATARADVNELRNVAHAHDATVNDVLLTAVVGTLGAVLRRRGELVDSLIVSVPVSSRREASVAQLGNRVGVIPVEVPTAGAPLDRLAMVAHSTRARRQQPGRGASTVLLAPAFRAMARVGLLDRFVQRQHLVSTFVTNIRGPQTPLSFLGATVVDMTAVSVIAGNITVGFAALSYAGTLSVTVIADPDHCPDLSLLVTELQSQLDELVGGAGYAR
jgi:diacylglycerol O-acyltransferase / wax synthase